MSDKTTQLNEKVAAENALKFVAYAESRGGLSSVSLPVRNVVQRFIQMLPHSPERTDALRRLLEAKGHVFPSLARD